MWLCRIFGHKFIRRYGGSVVYESDYCWRCGKRRGDAGKGSADARTEAALRADTEAAMKWAREYEAAHGHFKPLPTIPDFMVPF